MVVYLVAMARWLTTALLLITVQSLKILLQIQVPLLQMPII